MIPKIVHCVWLSGEALPANYQMCLDSWKRVMPDYEIKEWSINNLPAEVLEHPFVKDAITAKKWAFATDYIRVWALYNYGGIYMDLDVEVYKSFNPFLGHRAFSCIEFNPRNFYKNINKIKTGCIRGLNIEAAVLGAEPKHPWIKDIMEFYNSAKFSLSKQVIDSLIMPLIVTRASIPYGFRYIPIYQVLENDVHIYPPDTFSSCYDLSITRCEESEIGRNVVRYARHKCAHSWFDEDITKTASYKIKHLIIRIIGDSNVKKIKRIFCKNRADNPI